jgi:transaldolase
MLQGVSFKSPLYQMTQTTATCLWNDSAAEAELAYAIDHGAVGATCNPVIAVEVVKKELPYWTSRIKALAAEYSTATEGELAWHVIEEMSATRAAMLRPVFEKYRGRNGRLSIQTDPRLFRNGEAILEQAIRFDALAPNMIVKISATEAGIWAIRRPRVASASTPRCPSACRKRWPSPMRSSADCTGESATATTCRRWGRCARLWSAASTTGSRSWPTNR